MANSTWTKEHVDGILGYRDFLLDLLVGGVMGVLGMLAIARTNPNTQMMKTEALKEAQIVYPPCETQELIGFPLDGREKVIVSIAQFRYVPRSPCKCCVNW